MLLLPMHDCEDNAQCVKRYAARGLLVPLAIAHNACVVICCVARAVCVHWSGHTTSAAVLLQCPRTTQILYYSRGHVRHLHVLHYHRPRMTGAIKRCHCPRTTGVIACCWPPPCDMVMMVGATWQGLEQSGAWYNNIHCRVARAIYLWCEGIYNE